MPIPRAEVLVIPGMDTPEYVREFFLAKGHPYLVFRLADVLELAEDDQLLILDLASKFNASVPDEGGLDLRGRVQRAGHRGHLVLPIGGLCDILEIGELQILQALCHAYRDVRQGKLEPSKLFPCDCTKKGPPSPDRGCNHCGGTGQVRVLLEMSDIETALAEGKTWDQIDKENIR